MPAPTLAPGLTCWRTATASRFALLPDGESYLPAMRAAIANARQSVLLVGWDLDPTVPMGAPAGSGDEAPRFCDEFHRLVSVRPELRIDILIWDMSYAYAVQRRERPQHAARWLPASVNYRLDGKHPVGASHHQKVLVVDDAIAFCGGADFTRNRWDSSAHRSDDARRRLPDGRVYAPRHEVMAAVDGPAAAALGDLVRERWRQGWGESLEPVVADHDPWPDGLAPDMVDVTIGISRTAAAWDGYPAVREVETLFLRAIARARRWIYLENQYVTAPVVREALARRLAEPDGPEVLLVCPLHSGGRADRLAMDRARKALVHRLRAADAHRRFRAAAPLSSAGEAIMVHSKVMVVDDILFRVGSANLNNRSLGFDTECDLSIEASLGDDAGRRGVLRLLCRMLAEHAGCDPAALEPGICRTGLFAALDALPSTSGKRLQSLADDRLTLLDRLVARAHPFDPAGVADNWKPWRRPA
jgi:phosphatidylserine/phosphatidylglycerophosphate/cardiolipin synthase-like enzyme